MSELTAIERLLIEHEITRRIHLYARLNDAGEFSALAALYTENGRFARPTDPDNFIEGRKAILASFLARPARLGRHVMTNIVVEAESATTARAVSTILLFLGADQRDLGGRIRRPVGKSRARLAVRAASRHGGD